MKDDEAPEAEGSESAKEEPLTITKAYEDALAAHEAEQGEPEPKEPKTAKAAPAKTVSAIVAEEAEHIRWLKSIEGMADKETGQLNTDRLAKAYFEMNKGFQSQAQRVNQINQLLQRPDVAQAIDRIVKGEPEKPKVEAKVEKTDEDILREFIDERAKLMAEAQFKPMNEKLQQAEVVIQKHLAAESVAAGTKMEEDYGKEEFAAMWPDIYQTIANAAAGQNMQPQQLISNLIMNGLWLQTMENIANNLAAPKYRTQLAEMKAQKESKDLEAKKRTRLTPKGSPEKSVRENVKIRSIRDAARAAEADHPEFAELK